MAAYKIGGTVVDEADLPKLTLASLVGLREGIPMIAADARNTAESQQCRDAKVAVDNELKIRMNANKVVEKAP